MTRLVRRAAPVLAAIAVVVAVRAQDVTFSSKVEAVRVDVLVTAGGLPVRGLTAQDFEIRDNGVLQAIDLVSFEQIPLNVVLSLDMSDSVAGERLEQLRDACHAVLDGLTSGDQAALVTFSQAIVRSTTAGIIADTPSGDITVNVDPGVRSVPIELKTSDRHQDLVAEGVDVAFRLGPMASSTLLARRLGTVARVVVASPAYLARRETPSRPHANAPPHRASAATR